MSPRTGAHTIIEWSGKIEEPFTDRHGVTRRYIKIPKKFKRRHVKQMSPRLSQSFNSQMGENLINIMATDKLGSVSVVDVNNLPEGVELVRDEFMALMRVTV